MKRLLLSIILLSTTAVYADSDNQPNQDPAQDSPYIKLVYKQRESFDKQMGCMAKAIYFEASGAEKAQRAVGETIINRVITDGYPDTVCGVIGDRTRSARYRHPVCQFSFMCEKKKKVDYDSQKWEDAKLIAADVLTGFVDNDREDITKGATQFHDARVNPMWAKSKEFVRTLHLTGLTFYKKRP